MLPSPVDQDSPAMGDFTLFSPQFDQTANVYTRGMITPDAENPLWDFPTPEYELKEPEYPIESNGPSKKHRPATSNRRHSLRQLNSSVPSTTKSSTDSESGSSPSQHRGKSSKSKSKNSHNQIEKRYRQNLNAQLEALHQTMVSLPEPENTSALTRACVSEIDRKGQPSKGSIITAASSVILRLQADNAKIAKEVKDIKAENQAYRQLLSNCTPDFRYRV